MTKAVALSMFDLTGFQALHDEATDTRVLLAWRGDGDGNGDDEASAGTDGNGGCLDGSSTTSGSNAKSGGGGGGAPALQQQQQQQQLQLQLPPPLRVMSFRGTASRANAVSDLKLWRTAVKPRRYFGGAPVQVHAGGCSRRGTACVLLQLF